MLEFLKQPGVYECCFFLLGIFCYRITAGLLRIIVMYAFAFNLSQTCYSLLIKTHKQLLLANEMKEAVLIEAKTSPEVLKEVVIEDKRLLDAWKADVIAELEMFVPEVVRESIDKGDFKN